MVDNNPDDYLMVSSYILRVKFVCPQEWFLMVEIIFTMTNWKDCQCVLHLSFIFPHPGHFFGFMNKSMMIYTGPLPSRSNSECSFC